MQIKKIQSRKPHEKSAAREAALREVKERNKKLKAAKIAASAPVKGKDVPKNKGGGKNKAAQSTGR